MKLIVSIFLLFLSLNVLAQAKKHKHVIDINTKLSYPLFASSNNEFSSYSFERYDDKLSKTGKKLATGLKIGYSYATKNNVMVGIEIGKFRELMACPTEVYIYSTAYNGTVAVPTRHEQVVLNTFSILPKIEFSNKNALLPIGFSHHVGIGFSILSLKEKDYNYRIDTMANYYSLSTSDVKTFTDRGLIDYTVKRKEMNFVYGYKVRIPITDYICFTTGVVLSLNVGVANVYNPNSQYYAYSSTSDTRWDLNNSFGIGSYRLRSFASLNVGVSFNL